MMNGAGDKASEERDMPSACEHRDMATPSPCPCGTECICKKDTCRWTDKEPPKNAQKPMIYVAGPISSSGEFTNNIRNGVIMGEKLRKAGLVPFIPHLSALSEIVCGASPWGEWLSYDEEIIRRCDALFRMSGESTGADREVIFARKLGLPIFYNLDEVRKWRANWVRKR